MPNWAELRTFEIGCAEHVADFMNTARSVPV
jgi:hypothetical protein